MKFPQSVMIWGAMPSADVGPLCFIKSKVNAAAYHGILEHFMLPSTDEVYGDASFIFQQDLAPAHTAKSANTWFNDHAISYHIAFIFIYLYLSLFLFFISFIYYFIYFFIGMVVSIYYYHCYYLLCFLYCIFIIQ